MSLLARLLASTAVIAAALTPQALSAQEKTFTHKGIAADADRYEAFLKKEWQTSLRKPAELKVSGQKSLATDPRAASRSFAAAVALDGKDAQAWLGLADALLAIKADTSKGSERYDLPVNASGAALRAYQLAGTDNNLRALALASLGEALTRRSYWRPAIDALAASLQFASAQKVRESYDKLRAEHGFRMTDYKTDNEAASPRVCVQFSEGLSRASSVDFAKFVSVDGKDPQSVVAEGRQLCLEGLSYGKRYEVQVRAGLPSDGGEALEKAIEIAAYVPDRKASARFTGRSYVLPSKGQQGIPVLTTNTTAVTVEVYRIGDRSLAGAMQNGDMNRQVSSYEIEQIKEKTGEKVYSGVLEVASKTNEDVTTAFPVSEAIGALKPGAYLMTASPRVKAEGDDSHERQLASQWFIVSDLGLTALSGTDGVHGFIRSLAGSSAVANAEVRLIARNNEVLGTAKSDAKGYVRFDAGLAKGEGGMAPALMVAANDGSADYAFLDLSAAGFDLSDRGVKGRDAPGALDAYLFSERGVYRPGEEVFLTGLVRDKAGLAASLPVTMIITRPDGVEHKRQTLVDGGLGGRSMSLELGRGVMTGTWRAKLYADPKGEPISQVSFLVEDFVPERIDLTLTPESKSIAIEERAAIAATGKYLYGPPAQNLALEGDIVVRLAKEQEGFAGYKFGLADEKIEPVRAAIEGLGSTDDTGKATLSVTLPAIPKTSRPLEADVMVRMREPGGRTIERTVTLPVDTKQARLGIKPLFGNHGVTEGDPAAFEVIALDATGKRADVKGLRWTLSRIDQNWQWYMRDGNWGYEAASTTRKIEAGTIDASADSAAKIAVTQGWGKYRLEVSSDTLGTITSVTFNSGWVSGGEVADSPEVLETALDKVSYKPGETAKLRIASKHGGRALVSILSNGLLASQEVDIPKGGGEVAIPVSKDWGPGAYATAILYRSMDEAAKRMPSRSIGVKWLAVDQSAATLKVAIAAEAKVKSGATLKVPMKIAGLAPGEEARVTVAAVDVGILNLTKYAPPNPEGWFYAQRKLGLNIYDYYGRLIDGMRADRGKLRSGGDSAGGMAMQAAPPSVETILSQYSGIVVVDKDGNATAEFGLPDFNGTVKLMAVAWSKDKVGHGEQQVIVRDPVALTVSAPRFLTLGDEANLDIALHNVEGATGNYIVRANPATPTERKDDAGKPVALAAGERKSESMTLKPADVGSLVYNITVDGPLTSGGEPIKVKRQLTFNVLPPAGDIRRTTVSQIAAGGKITLSGDLTNDLIASRTKINVSVGPQASLDVPGLLTALDRYPYGCAEQTTSRALPLVYANNVAETLGMATDAKIRVRVQGAIERLFEMQDSAGAFGLWGPSNADIWLTAYVTDFLTRAKEKGYTVNPRAFGQALDKLQNYVAYAKDTSSSSENRAYAMYVLARNARAPIGELRYFADTKLDLFPSPLAKAQIGAALSMMGDKERAEKTFAAALDSLEDKNKSVTLARADFGSNLRDAAALVTLASETGMAKTQAPKLINVIAKGYQARTYTSTQEQAWMLLAANALGDSAKTLALSVNGKARVGSLVAQYAPADLIKDGGVTITNNSDAPTDVVISVTGASLTPEPAISKGFKIERTYYTLDGKKVDLASTTGGISTVKQNDRFVAVVTIEAKDEGGRVLLVDRLPAGFEIENPHLVGGGDTKGLDWLKGTVKPEHAEFRDDRFVAAFNFFGKRNGSGSAPVEGVDVEEEGEGETPTNDTAKKPSAPMTSAAIAYIVRAVTPGTFVHPAATVEDMYRPERYARTAAGKLVVAGKYSGDK